MGPTRRDKTTVRQMEETVGVGDLQEEKRFTLRLQVTQKPEKRKFLF